MILLRFRESTATIIGLLTFVVFSWSSLAMGAEPVSPSGADSTVEILGERKCWHDIVLSIEGPSANQSDSIPNPFIDYAMVARFRHESGTPDYFVLGYYAADGNAASTGATSGNRWRAHLSPDKAGRWTYEVLFRKGPSVVFDFDGGATWPPQDGATGTFKVSPSDKPMPDARAAGRLQYVGKRHLRHVASGQRFLSFRTDHAGPKDNTSNTIAVTTFDPAEGDSDRSPLVSLNQRFTYDCAKMDVWNRELNQATAAGMHIEINLQPSRVANKADGLDFDTGQPGSLGAERMLYLQQMVARFGHHPSLSWHLHADDEPSPDQIRAETTYLREIDPYRHAILLHTGADAWPGMQNALMGDKNAVSGIVLDANEPHFHRRCVQAVNASIESGHAWVVTGEVGTNPSRIPDPRTWRRQLWANLTAGGAGMHVIDDRETSGKSFVAAQQIFKAAGLSFWKMTSADELIGNSKHDDRGYVLAQPGDAYLLYLPSPRGCKLNLVDAKGDFEISWIDPATGDVIPGGEIVTVEGGKRVDIGSPPKRDPEASDHDWIAIVRRQS